MVGEIYERAESILVVGLSLAIDKHDLTLKPPSMWRALQSVNRDTD